MHNLFTIVALLGALLASSCAGLTAREEILMPAMKVAWIAISKNVEQGIEYGLFSSEIDASEAAGIRSEIIAMDRALASGDPLRVADVNWHRLRRIAAQGIDWRRQQREIGYGVAYILNQRLGKFHEAYVALLGSL